jgi:hypothetical protein
MADAMGGPGVDPRAEEPPFRQARSAIAVGLLRAARVIEPIPRAQGGAAPPPSVRLDPAAGQRVGRSLERELEDMLEDAANRGITERVAKALLLTADIVRWIREGGDLPGEGAIELLEIHVAVFNDARHEEERESQRDLLAVLLAIVDAQAQEIHGGRWRHRRVDLEAAEIRDRRRFGENLDRLRGSRGLSIGSLAAQAELEVLAVVALIHAGREAGSSEIRHLAGALDVEPSDLFPDPPDGAPGAAAPAPAAAEDRSRGGESSE